jgi:hypothetical protein
MACGIQPHEGVSPVHELTLATYMPLIARVAFMKICANEMYCQRVWKKWLLAEAWAKAIGASALIDAASCAFDASREFQYSYDSQQIGLQCAFDGKIRWHK